MVVRPQFKNSTTDSALIDSEKVSVAGVKFDPRDESNFDKPKDGLLSLK